MLFSCRLWITWKHPCPYGLQTSLNDQGLFDRENVNNSAGNSLKRPQSICFRLQYNINTFLNHVKVNQIWIVIILKIENLIDFKNLYEKCSLDLYCTASERDETVARTVVAIVSIRETFVTQGCFYIIQRLRENCNPCLMFYSSKGCRRISSHASFIHPRAGMASAYRVLNV